jgi:hypothetical protein
VQETYDSLFSRLHRLMGSQLLRPERLLLGMPPQRGSGSSCRLSLENGAGASMPLWRTRSQGHACGSGMMSHASPNCGCGFLQSVAPCLCSTSARALWRCRGYDCPGRRRRGGGPGRDDEGAVYRPSAKRTSLAPAYLLKTQTLSSPACRPAFHLIPEAIMPCESAPAGPKSFGRPSSQKALAVNPALQGGPWSLDRHAECRWYAWSSDSGCICHLNSVRY